VRARWCPVAGAVGVLVSLTPLVWAEVTGVVPGVVVGIADFKTTDGGNPCHVELILQDWLSSRRLKIKRLETVNDPEGAFSRHESLDFLVTGRVVRSEQTTIATARIDDRNASTPRFFEKSGASACRDLAAAVVQHLGSSHTVGALVASRRTAARDRLEQNPDDFESLFMLGLADRFEGRWTEAREWFIKATRVRPDDPQVHFNLALSYKEEGDVDRWLEHLERAQELDPGDESVTVALGNYYLAKGEYDEALGHYEKCLDSPRIAPLVLWNLAVLHTRRGELGKADERLARIPTSSPFFTDARAWRSRLEDFLEPGDNTGRNERRSISIWKWLELPAGFGAALLGVVLCLLLAPYASNKDFGALKIPAFSPNSRRRLMFVGPLLFLACLGLFVPAWKLGAPYESDPEQLPVFEETTDVAHALVSAGESAER
jgi:Tfp pilus assembly protein PilF